MTKSQARETESMLSRLQSIGIARADAEQLRRISMTLHRWHELECGDGNNHGSWCIVRGSKTKRVFSRDPETQAPVWTGGEFTHDDDGASYFEHHHYLHGKGKDYVTHTKIPDREKGALARLAKIMAAYPTLSAYVQGDPRGASLYIIRPGDVPEGATVDSCYNRGIAVYQ